MFTVGWLEHVEVTGAIDLGLETSQEDPFEDFGERIEVGYWTVVGRIIRA